MHDPERSLILGLHPAHQHVFEVMLISQFLIETLELRVLDEANRDPSRSIGSGGVPAIEP
jgi:hypothetical protein